MTITRSVLWVLLIILMSTFIGCVSYRERPTRLYESVLNSHRSFDVAIVPGVPFKNGAWDTVMRGRVIWAHHLYTQGIIRNVIFSGGSVYSPYYESRIMGLYAMAMGIPAEHIFYESQAEHSTENVFYSYQIARQQGFKTIALVTDPFQSSMLKRFTRRRFGTSIVHLPFMVDTLKRFKNVDYAIDPISAFNPQFTSILERESYWRRFRGTLGAFIPWEAKNRKEKPL